MALAESTLDAYFGGFASNAGSSGAVTTWGTYSVPAGATLVAFLASNSASITGAVWATSTGQTLTQKTTYNGTTMPIALATWHNSGASSVSVTVTLQLTYSNNKGVFATVNSVSGDDGNPTVVATQAGGTHTPQLSFTPSKIGSLGVLYVNQQGATAAPSSFVSGSAADTSPASTGHSNSGGDAIGGGQIHQTTPNAQTTTPVTVGAGAPSATTFAVLLEFVPASSGTPATGSAVLDLAAAGTARAADTGTAALTLAATGSVRAADTGGATLALAASGTSQATDTGTATLTLSASGAAQAPTGGSAAIALTAGGTAQSAAAAAGDAELELMASGSAPAAAAGSAAIELTTGAAATAAAAGTATLLLSASGDTGGDVAGSAELDLSATSTSDVPGSAVLDLTSSGAAAGVAVAAAELTLTAFGILGEFITGDASIALTASGTAGIGGAGDAALTLAASGGVIAQALALATLGLIASGAAETTIAGTAVLILIAAGVSSGPTTEGYPEIESVLVAWGQGQYPDARVCTELPGNLAAVLPVIQFGRIGGQDLQITVDRPNVDVDCYDADRESARALAYDVWNRMRFALPGMTVDGAYISRVGTLAGPAWRPYDNTTLRKFGFTLQLFTRNA